MTSLWKFCARCGGHNLMHYNACGHCGHNGFKHPVAR